jgi:hypothetical protein
MRLTPAEVDAINEFLDGQRDSLDEVAMAVKDQLFVREQLVAHELTLPARERGSFNQRANKIIALAFYVGIAISLSWVKHGSEAEIGEVLARARRELTVGGVSPETGDE